MLLENILQKAITENWGKYMKHVAIITNIPAPYRVDFFDYLEKNYMDYRFTIIYSSKN